MSKKMLKEDLIKSIEELKKSNENLEKELSIYYENSKKDKRKIEDLERKFERSKNEYSTNLKFKNDKIIKLSNSIDVYLKIKFPKESKMFSYMINSDMNNMYIDDSMLSQMNKDLEEVKDESFHLLNHLRDIIGNF